MNENVQQNITYNWNAPLLPGTIVCANYGDFNGEKRVGLFFVIYDEQIDNNVFSKKNVVALKITSQTTLVSNYVATISNIKNQFLDKPCMVACSKVHVLHKEDNVYKVLGMVDPSTCKKVFQSYFKFISETERQLIDRI